MVSPCWLCIHCALCLHRASRPEDLEWGLSAWKSAQSVLLPSLVLALTSLATVTQLGSFTIPSEDWMDSLMGFLGLTLSQAESAN